jgi:hypothetical protein
MLDLSKALRDLFTASIALAATLASAPDVRAETVIQIEFSRLGADQLDEEILEQARTLHTQLQQEHRIFAWYDYSVRFPRNVASPYDHVVVTVFADASHIGSRNAAMPDIGRIVWRERAYPDYTMRAPGYETIASPYITVNFFQADLDDRAIQEAMRNEWKPLLNSHFVDTGRWTTWSRFNMPGVRRSDGYNFVIVARHQTFGDAEAANELPSDLIDHVRLSRAEVWRLNAILLPN